MSKADMSLIGFVEVAPELLGKLLQLPEGTFIEGIALPDRLGTIRLRIRGAGWPVQLGGLIPMAEPAIVKTREARPEDMIHAIDWRLPT